MVISMLLLAAIATEAGRREVNRRWNQMVQSMSRNASKFTTGFSGLWNRQQIDLAGRYGRIGYQMSQYWLQTVQWQSLRQQIRSGIGEPIERGWLTLRASAREQWRLWQPQQAPSVRAARGTAAWYRRERPVSKTIRIVKIMGTKIIQIVQAPYLALKKRWSV